MGTGIIHTIPEWLELIFLAFCIGIGVCSLWVLDDAADISIFIPRMWRLFAISAAAMAASSIGDLFVRAAEMSGQPLLAVFPVLPTVVLRTHLGHVWLARIVAIIWLLILLFAGKRYRDRRVFMASLIGILAVIAMTKSASGHAADAGDFSIAEFVDWSHLMAVSFWGGGLIVLSAAIFPNVAEPDEQPALIAGIAGRFSRIAGYAVGVIAITAALNARSFVGSFDALHRSPYGWTVTAKIGLFLILISLGAYNRYVAVPFLQKQASPNPASLRIGRFIRFPAFYPIAQEFIFRVRVEAFLLLVVLFLASLLRHEIPARHFAHLRHEGMAGHGAMHEAAKEGGAVVRLETTPADVAAGKPVKMTARIQDRDGRPLQGLMVHHERLLHAILIGRDLNFYGHIHPEDAGPVTDKMLKEAVFPLRFTFPKGGEYLVGLDFMTAEGMYSRTSMITVAGKPAMEAPKIDLAEEKDFGEYHVSLRHSPRLIKAGTKTTLRYLITRNGRPVTDLDPYLGAPMHLAIVSSDLSQFIHTHGTLQGEAFPDKAGRGESTRFGPEIVVEAVFPAKGKYKIFGQVKHRGKVLLFDFMVDACCL